MNNWQFFANIYTGISTPIEGSVDGLIAALSAYLSPITLALGVVYIAGTAGAALVTPGRDVVHGFIGNMIRVAAVYFIVSSAANFNQYFGTIFLTSLPAEIGNAVSGATGAHVLNGGAFDTVWNKAWTAGLAVYKSIPWTLKGVALSMMIVVYWTMGILTIGLGFMIYLGCHISLVLVVGLGPLFVTCFLFPATRRFFEGWIAGMVSLVLTQVLATALLSLLVATENTTISQIAADGSDNIMLQFQMLLYAMVLFALCAWIAVQVPGIARGIAGGVYHQTSVYSQIVFGGAASVARGAAGLPGAIAQSIQAMRGGDSGSGGAGAAPRQPGGRQPPGRSMSDSGRSG